MTNSHTQQVLQLFVRHQPRIKGFILALLPDFAAAEDVLQETFLVVQRKSADFDPGTNFLAWTFRIARFQVMKAQTAHQRHAERLSDAVLESLADSAPVEPWDDQRLALLPHCLDKLAPQARRIVDLFYRDEHKPQEIAQRLSWTPAAVSVALSRARRALRECIERRLASQTPSIS
jgi:RNA polymerase sigma-70 factor (ECF subfamily)